MSKNLNQFDPLKPLALTPGETRMNMIELIYLSALTELSANRFKWSGLPDEIDSRFLEMTLFRNGLSVFFHSSDMPFTGKDPYDRFFSLQGAGGGIMNMYNNPTEFVVYGSNVNFPRIQGSKCVPIWCNMTRTPDHMLVALYANRLAENDVSIDISAMNLRQPTVIVASEETRLSWKNVMQQKMRGAFTIWGTNNMDLGSVQKFDVAGDVKVLEAMQLSRSRIWNDCMTLLGIDNANQEKKERLVAGEVSANDAQVSAHKAVALSSRRYAAEQINRMYPELSVSVDYNTDIEEENKMIFASAIAETETVDNNG